MQSTEAKDKVMALATCEQVMALATCKQVIEIEFYQVRESIY